MTVDEVAPGKRFSLAHAQHKQPEDWSAEISRRFVPLTAEPVAGRPLAGVLDDMVHGSFRLTTITGSAQRVIRGHAEMARSSTSEVYLNVQLSGTGHAESGGHRVSTPAGAAAVVSSEDAFALSFDQPFQQLCVAMPTQWFTDRIGQAPHDLAARAVNLASPLGKIASASLDALATAGSHDEREACCEVFGYSLRRLVHLEAATQPIAATPPLLRRIVSLIRHRLDDTTLSPAQAASELGCSVSTLHLQCQLNGASFGSMLQSARLHLAAIELRRSRVDVGRIAFRCGFNDPSHFSRLFKGRFGLTPLEFHKRGRA